MFSDDPRVPLLIVGLGNPGLRYRLHRHNLGYLILERFAGARGFVFNRERQLSLTGEGFVGDRRVIVAKPLTYMNSSGRAVRRLLDYSGLGSDNLVVLHDDLDMPLGKVRRRHGGGHGGHNGVRSLIEELGTASFRRIKIGIGRPAAGVAAEAWVLSEFTPDERPVIEDAIDRAAALLQREVEARPAGSDGGAADQIESDTAGEVPA